MEQKHKLKKLIKELEKYRGRHTELISVYAPAGYNINLINSQLSQEVGTAANIKSKTTRQNVTDALNKILQELKLYKKTPENGMVIFSGNISERPGKDDFRLWIIEPPEPLNIRLYRCDQTFVLEPLKEMIAAKYAYGLIVMDNQNACIGLLSGKLIQCKKEMTSIVPGKYRAGGQSAARFQRVRQNLVQQWHKEIGEIAKEIFDNVKELKGIIIGGPGPVKENFLNNNNLAPEYRKKVIGTIDIGYTDVSGLNELVNKAQYLLANEEIAIEKRIMNRFYTTLVRNSGKVVYGKTHVISALEQGAVDTMLLSEALDIEEIDNLIEKAKNFGSNYNIISTETDEGKRLADMGGYAAILRYELN